MNTITTLEHLKTITEQSGNETETLEHSESNKEAQQHMPCINCPTSAPVHSRQPMTDNKAQTKRMGFYQTRSFDKTETAE